MELLSKALTNAVDVAGAFTTVEELAANFVVSDATVELAATVKEFVHGERSMNGGLVNDGRLVGLFASGDNGVNAVLVDR